ncbi:hypothetical protein E2562_038789 [Oryza meyeriana var. granulata]|uniref:DUF834 domain-containing protein n=1 Tax=Oryza meyeriana var. granulata TaxID=110450 RepID=A0A6G1C2E1_9ORYZ|nr:hypothetical protein E2562_038789 [Oryza meyeriana var. granulata]
MSVGTVLLGSSGDRMRPRKRGREEQEKQGSGAAWPWRVVATEVVGLGGGGGDVHGTVLGHLTEQPTCEDREERDGIKEDEAIVRRSHGSQR